MNKEQFIKKAQGCLAGLACGDALGDLGRSPEHRKKYGIVTNIYDGASSTDDTEFAIFVARMLLDCNGQLTPDAVLSAWKKYILEQGGLFERGGLPLYGAVANLQRGILPPLSGRYNVMNIDDGAAMRVAPIGVVCAGNPDGAARMAVLEAQVSHDRDGIWAAQAVAAGIAVALDGGGVEAILSTARQQVPADSWLGYALDKAMQICQSAETIEYAWEPLHNEFWTPSHSAAPEAIPQALAVFQLTHGDFRKGMFWACNFGRDADTIGAVVGALSGAHCGIEAIPAGWVEKVRYPAGVCLKFAAQEDILELATALAELVR